VPPPYTYERLCAHARTHARERARDGERASERTNEGESRAHAHERESQKGGALVSSKFFTFLFSMNSAN
jgi:hypothetical protein